ncbi:MAG: succinate:quinone oxidoreductase, partial [Verrucomicrobiota bacterium]
LHYTVLVQAVNLTGHDFSSLRDVHGQPDVYRMMIIGFSNPTVSGFYLLGIGLLCFHLSHGIWAMLQSLGLVNPVYREVIERASVIGAVLLFIGYASIPVAILTGVVK